MKLHFETSRLKVFDASEEEISEIIAMEEATENRNFVFQGTFEEHLSEIKSNDTLLLSIKTKKSSELVGFCLAAIDNKSESFELRRIVINVKGIGYGKEFFLGILKYCFIDLGMNRFWLDVFTENIVGINLYNSIGLVHEGTLRQSFKGPEGYRDQMIFSMLRDEYFNKYNIEESNFQ